MKKRKNVILSAITCFVSICMLMLGVYAASSPSVSIGGQVSYTARDASVLVQGVTNNSGTAITAASFASMGTLPENQQQLIAKSASDKKNTQTEYMDWTKGNGVNSNETMSDWTIGEISFAEDSNGIKAIKVGFQFTNYSNYPVTATLMFDKTVKETSDANVTRTSEEQDKVITKDLGIVGSANASATVEITFAVTDDSKGVNADGLLGMNIKFEKTATNAQASSYTLSSTERSTGKLTMGKQSSSSTVEDVEWKCFAYSTDGTTWTSCTGEIPSSAKYGYFVLDTYVSVLKNQVFLSGEKYNRSTGMHTDISGVTNVNANDYYYSDVRQTLKELGSTLNISFDNAIYCSIKDRSLEDLYKLNSVTFDDSEYPTEWERGVQSSPTNANMTAQDKFWLLSMDEVYKFFDADSRNLNSAYWLRTPFSEDNWVAYFIHDGEYDVSFSVDADIFVRPAFGLQLA